MLSQQKLDASKWKSGSKWEMSQVESLKMQPEYEPALQNVIPCALIAYNDLPASIKTNMLDDIFYKNPASPYNRVLDHSMANLSETQRNEFYTVALFSKLTLAFQQTDETVQYPLLYVIIILVGFILWK